MAIRKGDIKKMIKGDKEKKKKEIASGQAPRNDKAEGKKYHNDSVVGQAKKDREEIDIFERRQEVKEGAEARDRIKEIEKAKEEKSEALAKYCGGLPYERERVKGEIVSHLNRSIEELIEAGKRLVVVREMEGGGFMQFLDEISLPYASAWRLIALTKMTEKYPRVNTFKVVDMKKGIGKLYSLLNVPDEELAEFDETGLFKGATVEDINKMSVSQFRKLIAEKEDWKARAKQFELEVQTKYDTKTRYEKKIEQLEKDKKGLQEKIDDFGLSKDDKEALQKIQNLKLSIRGNINFIEAADLRGHSDEVKAELLSLATYIHDRGELCLGRVLEIVGNVDGTVAKEAAERDYLKKYGEDNE